MLQQSSARHSGALRAEGSAHAGHQPGMGDLAALRLCKNGITLVAMLPAKADNTVKENKNNTNLKQMGMLVSKRLFRCTGLFFSRVGHTRLAGRLGLHCD